MRRTWFKSIQDGRVFRNCGLIAMDRRRPENWLPRRQSQLSAEWWETFRRGVMEPGSQYNHAEPGPHDRFLPWDDSPEATEAWVARFTASKGRIA